MKYKSNVPMNKDLRGIDESHEHGFEHPVSPVTSTPRKVKDQRSVSLLDISEISSLKKERNHASAETLGSTSSICKDSGYNQSESSLISEKVKEDGFGVDFRVEYFRLLDDLKFKDVLISSLYESNHNLRLKAAEAENKISELRLKCQSHCKCCTFGGESNSLQVKIPERENAFKYSVSAFAVSEPCLYIAPPPAIEKLTTSPSSSQQDKPSSLPCDDAFSKVKHWQHSVDTLNECHKKLVSHTPLPNTSMSPENSPTMFVKPPPERLTKTMSYMETSRALAETYRRRQENSTDLFSFQVIDDHSVSVAPLRVVRGSRSSNFNPMMDSFGKYSPSKVESPREMTDLLPGKQNILNNLLIRNQAQSSSRLVEVLREASKCGAVLTRGLSRLPGALEEIRSLSDQT